MGGNNQKTGRPKLAGMVEEETAYPIWCDRCGSDAFILIESARRQHWAPAGYLDITYFCSKCNAIYGHLVSEADLKAEFMAAIAVAARPHPMAEYTGYDEAS
ncbi:MULTISPECIES: hypothetical protein [unclassified Arthrobacter]|uniref:hypothetical protein n=1 Tax=unclassified Arthrobacter TaxID=235627 RepID=UPI00159E7B10|nr:MULTISPECIES: hypothetical protein [unclassified Arthrobacter]MCQ9163253.1 hypothetical protein [Arthrobacter sp. STN4]NVM98615.1 hypothetical protein [Arthrobacter sp. SDTb3-6]